MANIQERKTKDGKTTYRVQIRLKGHPSQTATFSRKTDARKWVQQIEPVRLEKDVILKQLKLKSTPSVS